MLVSEGASCPPQWCDWPRGHSPLPSHPQGQAVWSLLQLLKPPTSLSARLVTAPAGLACEALARREQDGGDPGCPERGSGEGVTREQNAGDPECPERGSGEGVA